MNLPENDSQQSLIAMVQRYLDGLEDAARRLQDAQIECLPAVECIAHYDSPQTLFYIDPPYVASSRQSSYQLYSHEMSDGDHEGLARVLHAVQGMVVLSGYPSPLYDGLYGDWLRLEKPTTTNGNSAATEALWLSPRAVALDALPLFRLNGEGE